MTRITFEENGQSKIMTAQEIIIRNLVRIAAHGDIRAINMIFALQQRYQGSSETTLNLTELDQKDRKILEEYFATLETNGSGPAPAPSGNEQARSSGENTSSDGKPIAKPGASDGDAT
jgi:hypothetical protein